MYFAAILALLWFVSPAVAADCILSFDNTCIREVPTPPKPAVEAAYEYRRQTPAQTRQERERQESTTLRNLRRRILEELTIRMQ